MALHVSRAPTDNATMDDYEELMNMAPMKFDAKASSYHKAKGNEPRCDECLHWFEREVDQYHVCEIVRPVPEEEIMAEWTCKFYTADGKKFPLYKGPK